MKLLLLQRAWQAETHAGFHPLFRDAVVSIAHSTHRLGLPQGVMNLLCSFFHLDWWARLAQAILELCMPM
jgi:hypothetical protein